MTRGGTPSRGRPEGLAVRVFLLAGGLLASGACGGDSTVDVPDGQGRDAAARDREDAWEVQEVEESIPHDPRDAEGAEPGDGVLGENRGLDLRDHAGGVETGPRDSSPDEVRPDHDATGSPDEELDSDPGRPPTFCRAFADCDLEEACDFALGRCEPRDSWRTGRPALYAFHPPAGAAGDVIVIDGSTFFTNVFTGQYAVRFDIGGKPLESGLSNIGIDENRLIGRVPAGASGTIRVVFADGGGTRTFQEPFQVAPAGVLPCDGTTPGRKEPGTRPTETGPHGAGYLDVPLHLTRVFYPAECGGLRRPGVPGVRPLVLVLHGNGALHLQHEHIGQLLATWGFVVVLPRTEATGEWSQEASRQIREVLERFRGRGDLESLHPALLGVGTTDQYAVLCHSRGCGRAQEALQDHPELKPHLIGSVFLGPFDRDIVLPGAFLVFGGGKDGQSTASFTEDAYRRQHRPKWKVWIPGANHGNFCDHKVYFVLGDAAPTLRRHQQLEIVQSFTVPFLQRTFRQPEPFAEWLDAPPPSTLYTVESSR